VNIEQHQKVTAGHLKREAYLYVRQSTLRQVFENSESTKRQYALKERAVALGWPLDRVVVIDTDLGQSGAAPDREGFQKLVAAVGMGQVGIVLGLEVSRLARNSAEWHRLLEICALTETLILDEDGLYDPGHFNDRLLLGLKGTMSEAELHVLRARLQGGIRAKARRGELKTPLPVGLAYNLQEQVVLDPDQQVQQAMRLFFDTFRHTGSASATVRSFREQGLLFPRRLRSGPHKGELAWGPLRHWSALRVLQNPRYAGAFVYGRRHTRWTQEGRERVHELPRAEWHSLLPGAHPGYVSWEEYEDNLGRLRGNARAQGEDRRQSPPREGPALLQGLVVCARCGERMTVRYYSRSGRTVPAYLCQKDGIANARPICQHVLGWELDRAVGALLVETVTPLALEVALAVQDELNSRAEEVDRLRHQQVERARYEAELAQRRYLRVDPDNRLVADSLEADWNQKLRALAASQVEYERQREADRLLLDDEQRARVLALATDFPRLWQDPLTPDRERKRMVRLLLEDITLLRHDHITAHIRFKGGATRTLTLPLPLPAPQLRQTRPEVVQEIDRLLDQHTDGEVAAILNQRGFQPGVASAFDSRIVAKLRRHYGLPDRFARLRQAGLLTLSEVTSLLDLHHQTAKAWEREGRLRAHVFNDKGERLFEHPGDRPPGKYHWQRLQRRAPSFPSKRAEGVQSDA